MFKKWHYLANDSTYWFVTNANVVRLPDCCWYKVGLNRKNIKLFALTSLMPFCILCKNKPSPCEKPLMLDGAVMDWPAHCLLRGLGQCGLKCASSVISVDEWKSLPGRERFKMDNVVNKSTEPLVQPSCSSNLPIECYFSGRGTRICISTCTSVRKMLKFIGSWEVYDGVNSLWNCCQNSVSPKFWCTFWSLTFVCGLFFTLIIQSG